MARKAYRCTNCNFVTPEWESKCPECKEYGTLDRDDTAVAKGSGTASSAALPGKTGARASKAASGRAPQRIGDIKAEDYARFSTEIGEFDRVLGGGLVPGGVILLAGPPGIGKALALDTKLVTPTGWTTMGEVQVGDSLIGQDGKPTKVVAATEIMLDRPTYKVEFSDGSVIIADEQHQWETITSAQEENPQSIKTTIEIKDTLYAVGGILKVHNHAVRTTAPIDLPEQMLPVSPYAGALQLVDSQHGDANIPLPYLRASLAQREAMLDGFLDSPARVSNSTGVKQLEFSSQILSEDVYELVVSLGYQPTKKLKDYLDENGSSSTSYVIKLGDIRDDLRYITKVELIDSVPVRCVEVDNEDHMYLAGESMIPTHNSTLALHAAKSLSDAGKKVLIISGEETEAQIASRGIRIGALSPNLYLLAESNLTNALSHIAGLQPDVVVVDSMQTLVSENSEGRVGSPTQVAEVANDLTQVAKVMNIPMILIGHITKDGNIAGPRVVEHLVDVVLYFEGSRDSDLRLLRGIKNRYGQTDELGAFQHTEDGLIEVSDPSGFFLSEHDEGITGFATSILVEGNRPLPIEIQALVTTTALPNPRKISNGLDHARVMMIQAILEKHGGLRLGEKDVYVSTAGGLLTKDSSIDLAIAAAIISSYRSLVLPEHTIFLGETSLTGEIRPPRDLRKRVNEAQRLGFNNIIMPKQDNNNSVSNIRNLLERLKREAE